MRSLGRTIVKTALTTMLAAGSSNGQAQTEAEPSPQPTSAASQPSDAVGDSAEYFLNLDRELFEIGSSLTDSIMSVTKTKEVGAKTPAVITIVTRDEIVSRGYTSLAEVLRTVPGLYDVYDLVSHNIGVRGVNGGARASGSVLKLMINGVPVDFRATTGNQFGEALIPIQLVDRIEVIRGPASALYGANAFLGVINVITVPGERIDGVRVMLRGGMVRSNPGGGLGVVAGGSSDRFEAILGVEGFFFDRSGLGLPGSSPNLDDPNFPVDQTARSEGDISRPKTFLGEVKAKRILGGELSLLASIQSSSDSAEFQDLSVLTHNSSVSFLNQNYRLQYELASAEKFAWKASASYLIGEPTKDDRLDARVPNIVYKRELRVRGFGFATEARYSPDTRLSLTAGADYSHEDHQPLSYGTQYESDLVASDGAILIPRGSYSPGPLYGQSRLLENIGAFLQLMSQFGEDWNSVIGGRVDLHSSYGVNVSPRAGVVFAPDSFSFKLLYGSSFKAPSATQLYGRNAPVYLDLVGNPDLKAQRAHTVELAGGYALPDKKGEVLVNVYSTWLRDRVAYVQDGLLARAENMLDEHIVGGELDARYNLTREFHLRWSTGIAKTLSSESGKRVSVDVRQPLFPSFQSHLTADYELRGLGLRLSAETSYISSRVASQLNAQAATEAYSIPGYVYTAIALAMPEKKLLGNRTTQFSLRVSDLLNQTRAEPGFGGIDVPSLGRTTMLTLVQSL